MAKGARYLIFFNDIPGIFDFVLDFDILTDVAALAAVSAIDDETGETFIKALKDGKKLKLKMIGPEKYDLRVRSTNNTNTGGAVSNFSSWGPTFEMDTKPQCGAIGGHVLSTYLRASGKYSLNSGTSMACPQAAGIIALIRQVRGAITPQEIQDLLSSNANPQLFNDGTKFYDYLAPVPQQGAGLLQAYDAAYSTALLSPSGLSFNYTDHFANSLNFTLRNTDKEPATYNIMHRPAITMPSLTRLFTQPPALNSARPASLCKVARPRRLIKVSATPPEGLDAKRLALWSGYIAINGTDGASLSLPYQGLTGSLHEHILLGSNDTWISNSTDFNDIPSPIPPNTTFLLPKPGNAGPEDLMPQLSVKLALGCPMIRADIVYGLPQPRSQEQDPDARILGFPALWNPRGHIGFPWDGLLDSGRYAPAGTYKFVVRALRINGDAKKKEEWDVSTTSAFSIQYL
ncbi:hypothetical protein E4U09_005147 [Claviceps aff. purpurea]|uniref:Peptidase S8/S53 domain-containing protein n=1 Tax=Claviceps aff. purpurea TaxID=1967640 RepID=A0A9P7QH27_9HYPO|nr:hypothetical protein E4U09_005147 [Claviceps aff. purpurea]